MSDAVLEFLASRGVVPDEESLAHYGVPGMKWGRRKGRGPTAVIQNPRTGSSAEVQLTRRQEKQINRGAVPQKHDNTIAARPKNRRMSDAELRAKVNRLQMEKQLKDLTTSPPRADSFAKQVLKDAGKQAVRTLATRAVSVGIELALGKAAGQAVGRGKPSPFLDAMVAAGAKGKKANKTSDPAASSAPKSSSNAGSSSSSASSNSSNSSKSTGSSNTRPKYKPASSKSPTVEDIGYLWNSTNRTPPPMTITLRQLESGNWSK